MGELKEVKLTLTLKLREDQTDPSTWNWVSLLDLVPEESVKVAVELPMTQILDTIFLVRIVGRGERYGFDGCQRREKELFDLYGPLVEFYDNRFDCDPWTGRRCQFISRYFLKTLMEDKVSGGLCLQEGIPEWNVPSHAMREVYRILQPVWEKWNA